MSHRRATRRRRLKEKIRAWPEEALAFAAALKEQPPFALLVSVGTSTVVGSVAGVGVEGSMTGSWAGEGMTAVPTAGGAMVVWFTFESSLAPRSWAICWGVSFILFGSAMTRLGVVSSEQSAGIHWNRQSDVQEAQRSPFF